MARVSPVSFPSDKFTEPYHDKSTLVQVMAWCHQATSHCLCLCWSSSRGAYYVVGPRWVKNHTHLFTTCIRIPCWNAICYKVFLMTLVTIEYSNEIQFCCTHSHSIIKYLHAWCCVIFSLEDNNLPVSILSVGDLVIWRARALDAMVLT